MRKCTAEVFVDITRRQLPSHTKRDKGWERGTVGQSCVFVRLYRRRSPFLLAEWIFVGLLPVSHVLRSECYTVRATWTMERHSTISQVSFSESKSEHQYLTFFVVKCPAFPALAKHVEGSRVKLVKQRAMLCAALIILL